MSMSMMVTTRRKLAPQRRHPCKAPIRVLRIPNNQHSRNIKGNSHMTKVAKLSSQSYQTLTISLMMGKQLKIEKFQEQTTVSSVNNISITEAKFQTNDILKQNNDF